MKLKFIGKDGSMGLMHGAVYECEISTHGSFVYVDWRGDWTKGYCPYSSLAKLLENWEERK